MSKAAENKRNSHDEQERKLNRRYSTEELNDILKNFSKKDATEEDIQKYSELFFLDGFPRPPIQKGPQLHFWHIDWNNNNERVAHGIVTGHPIHQDTSYIETSPIRHFDYDRQLGEFLLIADDVTYRCPREYCVYELQEKNATALPYYDLPGYFKKAYDFTPDNWEDLPDNSVLITLADFCPNYFHSYHYMPGQNQPPREQGHLMYITDSSEKSPLNAMQINDYVLQTEFTYFAWKNRITLIFDEEKDIPVYLENIGNSMIYVQTSFGSEDNPEGIIWLGPGQRKAMCWENTNLPLLEDIPLDSLPAMPTHLPHLVKNTTLLDYANLPEGSAIQKEYDELKINVKIQGPTPDTKKKAKAKIKATAK